MEEILVPFIELSKELIRKKFPINFDYVNQIILEKRISEVLKYHYLNQFHLSKHILSNGIFETSYSDVIRYILEKDIYFKLSPKLKEITESIVNNFTSFIGEIIHSYNSDLSELQNIFYIPRNSIIKNIEFLGDYHKEGRCVSLITLDDGNKLIFRPTEAYCYNNLKYYADFFDDFVSLPKILERKKYCWVEFIEKEQIEDFKDYSNKAGKLLSFCQIMGIEDLHFENIIYSGNKFFLIDFETSFGSLESYKEKHIHINNRKITLSNTPLFTSLLPIWAKGIKGGFIDNSGFFGPNFLELKKSIFEDIGKSSIHTKNVTKTFHTANYIITKVFIESYCEGISMIKKKIVSNQFKNKNNTSFNRRKIYRSTSEYFYIKELYIEHLSKTPNRENYLENLLKINSKVPTEIIPIEIHQLKSANIPFFEEKVTSEQVNEQIRQRTTECLETIDILKKIITNSITSLSWKSVDVEQNYCQQGFAKSGAEVLN